MNWVKFLQAKAILVPDDEPLIYLYMQGVMFDNDTKYLENQKGEVFSNTYQAIFGEDGPSGDFVWTGDNIRAHGMMSSGGHPALAGFDAVYCAGVIEDWGFFFHSGHYRPPPESIIRFMFDFIERSCAGHEGEERDNLVARLANMKLRLYADDSEQSTYDTTFAQLVKRRSRPGSPAPSSPKPWRSSLGEPSPSGGSRLSRSYSGLPSTRAPKPRPRWQLPSDASHCKSCNNKFNLTRRRHHCRGCGYVFCSKCLAQRALVELPAVRNNEVSKAGKNANSGIYKVCTTCAPAKT